ncbi:MAG: hypothetical protein AVDCRST_MAG26-753, partial [uncultured Chloroflexia bacterium]
AAQARDACRSRRRDGRRGQAGTRRGGRPAPRAHAAATVRRRPRHPGANDGFPPRRRVAYRCCARRSNRNKHPAHL